jgi:hypothetical protein
MYIVDQKPIKNSKQIRPGLMVSSLFSKPIACNSCKNPALSNYHIFTTAFPHSQITHINSPAATSTN